MNFQRFHEPSVVAQEAAVPAVAVRLAEVPVAAGVVRGSNIWLCTTRMVNMPYVAYTYYYETIFGCGSSGLSPERKN